MTRRLVTYAAGNRRLDDETWFEVIVEVRVGAAEGGLVVPGLMS